MAIRSDSGSRAACRQATPASDCGSTQATDRPFAASAMQQSVDGRCHPPETGDEDRRARGRHGIGGHERVARGRRHRRQPGCAIRPRRLRPNRERPADRGSWASGKALPGRRRGLAAAASSRAPSPPGHAGSRSPGASCAASRQSQCKPDAGMMLASDGRSVEAFCHCCRSQASSGSTCADGQAFAPQGDLRPIVQATQDAGLAQVARQQQAASLEMGDAPGIRIQSAAFLTPAAA